MKILSLMAVSMTALSLAACSDGSDVYVRDPGKTTTTSSSATLECMVAPGNDVCERPMDSVPETDRARVRDALQAVSDFAALAESTANEVEVACRGIVTESSGTLPAIPTASTLDARVGIVCLAAHDAIVAAERGVLRIGVTPSSCAESTPRTCTTPASAGALPCAPPTVTPSTEGAASTVTAAVGVALSHHYGTLLAVKDRVTTLAALAGRITANADALAGLPADCVSTSAKLAAEAQSRIGAVTSATGLVVDATTTISR